MTNTSELSMFGDIYDIALLLASHKKGKRSCLPILPYTLQKVAKVAEVRSTPLFIRCLD